MNIKTSKKFFQRLLSLCSLLAMMLLFQNCGTSEDGISDALTNYDAAQADKLQFAFDASIDHIGYMSCESDAPQAPHFNFKAGAFNDGEGLKFRENFMSSLGALSENKSKLLEYLFASKRNSNAGVVMSIRESGQFRGPVRYGEGNTEDFVAPMLWNPAGNIQLANPKISSLLYENPNGVNYLSGFKGGTGKSFETELYYTGVGAQSLVFRPALQSNSYLSFTFAVDDLENGGSLARSPYDPKGLDAAADSSVFGKGYQMDFTQFDVGRTSSPQVVMTKVTGFDLENESSLGEGWICPQDERYIIMKDATDAMRRFDGAPSGATNKPWMAGYDDGGKGVGGYYVDRLMVDIFDENQQPAMPIDPNDGVGDGDDTEQVNLTHKVLCPMVPDEMISGQSEHIDPAWKRVRNLLSSDEWYVYRGDRYNCVVPKKSAGSCYGKFEKAQGNNGGIPRVQYFASEDYISEKLTDNKRVQAEIDNGNSADHAVFPVVTDCEADSGDASSHFCPHILSICYKQ